MSGPQELIEHLRGVVDNGWKIECGMASLKEGEIDVIAPDGRGWLVTITRFPELDQPAAPGEGVTRRGAGRSDQ